MSQISQAKSKRSILVLVAVAAFVCATWVASLAGRGVRAAKTGPVHVVMLVCSTDGSQPPLLSAVSTDPSLRLDLKGGCAAALKAIVDSGMQIIEVAYGEETHRIVYTGGTVAYAQDHNNSRSNKTSN